MLAPTYHRHNGFYLHTDLGFASASTSGTTKFGGRDFSFSGAGGSFAIALGGAVAHNLIVFGELAVVAVEKPLVKVDGREVSAGVRPQSFGVGGIGPGVSYYFDPSNIFISASLLVSSLTITDVDGVSQTTAGGPGLALKAGKEWWVSKDWGLGFIVGVYASSSKDKKDEVDDPATWQSAQRFP